jgi:hypothetical protein
MFEIRHGQEKMAASVKKEPSYVWRKNVSGFWCHHATAFGLG